jgi:hypothetical protein
MKSSEGQHLLALLFQFLAIAVERDLVALPPFPSFVDRAGPQSDTEKGAFAGKRRKTASSSAFPIRFVCMTADASRLNPTQVTKLEECALQAKNCR